MRDGAICTMPHPMDERGLCGETWPCVYHAVHPFPPVTILASEAS